MRINIENNRFVVIPEMDYAEFERLLPLPAYLAVNDLGVECKGETFVIKDGCLYASCKVSDKRFYYFFDNSVRRWQACDQP